MVGTLLAPFFARLLPSGLETRVAAVVMASDRWQAGAGLMKAGNADGWDAIERSASLWQLNRDAIQTCQRLADKARERQACRITVAPRLD